MLCVSGWTRSGPLAFRVCVCVDGDGAPGRVAGERRRRISQVKDRHYATRPGATRPGPRHHYSRTSAELRLDLANSGRAGELLRRVRHVGRLVPVDLREVDLRE